MWELEAGVPWLTGIQLPLETMQRSQKWRVRGSTGPGVPIFLDIWMPKGCRELGKMEQGPRVEEPSSIQSLDEKRFWGNLEMCSPFQTVLRGEQASEWGALMAVSLWQTFYISQITWHLALLEGLIHSWRISHILIWKTSGKVLHMLTEALSDGVPFSSQAGLRGKGVLGDGLEKSLPWKVWPRLPLATTGCTGWRLAALLRSNQTCMSGRTGKWRFATRQPLSQGSHFNTSALPLVECGNSCEEGCAQTHLVHGWHLVNIIHPHEFLPGSVAPWGSSSFYCSQADIQVAKISTLHFCLVFISDLFSFFNFVWG